MLKYKLMAALGVIGTILAFALCLGALLIGLCLLFYPMFILECKQNGTIMNIPWKIDFWSGCYLYYKDMWIPHEQLYMLLGK